MTRTLAPATEFVSARRGRQARRRQMTRQRFGESIDSSNSSSSSNSLGARTAGYQNLCRHWALLLTCAKKKGQQRAVPAVNENIPPRLSGFSNFDVSQFCRLGVASKSAG